VRNQQSLLLDCVNSIYRLTLSVYNSIHSSILSSDHLFLPQTIQKIREKSWRNICIIVFRKGIGNIVQLQPKTTDLLIQISMEISLTKHALDLSLFPKSSHPKVFTTELRNTLSDLFRLHSLLYGWVTIEYQNPVCLFHGRLDELLPTPKFIHNIHCRAYSYFTVHSVSQITIIF